MILDAEDRGPSWEVEDDLDLLDGGTSVRDLVTHPQLRSAALLVVVALAECVLFVWFALGEPNATVSALLAVVAVLPTIIALAALDRLACVLTDRWRCRDCRSELERWSGTDAEREGAH